MKSEESVKAQITQEVIALLPCGGQATRIAPLPLSKELYPIGFRPGEDGKPRPKVVSHYLLEKLRRAGIQKAYCILRPGKWDIPAYFGDGHLVEMDLGYLVLRSLLGVPYTLDQAYPFVRHGLVVLGFPDILLQPDDLYQQLLHRWQQTQPDVLLGLFPCDRPAKAGMVAFQADGSVQQIIEKPSQTNLRFMWGTALWATSFTDFLHNYLSKMEPQPHSASATPQELPIGNVIQAAIEQGLRVEAFPFEQGSYLDIGTPEDLALAVRRYASQS